MDGVRRSLTKAAIDPCHHLFHVLFDATIVLDLRTAGYGNLDKAQTALIGWVLFQEPLNGLQPTDDALGVVEPVHTQAEQREGQVGLGAQARQALGRALSPRELLPRVIIDTEGAGPYPGDLPGVFHRPGGPTG